MPVTISLTIDRISASAPSETGSRFGWARQGGGAIAGDERYRLRFGSFEASGDAFLWAGHAVLGEHHLPSAGSALLCNFADVAPEAEKEFNAWYDSEHVPSLAALPGVERVTRYRSESAGPAYLALFELARQDIAQGEAWLEAARTPWTARMKPFTRGFRSYIFGPVSA